MVISSCILHFPTFFNNKIHLNGSGPQGEDLVPGPLGVPVHVDEDVDAVLVDAVRRLPVAHDLGEVHKVLSAAPDLLPGISKHEREIRARGVI